MEKKIRAIERETKNNLNEKLNEKRCWELFEIGFSGKLWVEAAEGDFDCLEIKVFDILERFHGFLLEITKFCSEILL